jgi:undecaprenyl-diphosphatase
MESPERRENTAIVTRGWTRHAWNLLFTFLRFVAAHARNAYATFGFLILGGTVVAVGLTWAFAKFAEHVMSGATLAFDDTIMKFMGAHQVPWIDAAMVEITSLGTGIVVAMIVVVSGLFLWLYNYKQSAQVLLVSTLGGLILNLVLKVGFNRPRPQVFVWGTHAVSSSFPSGHAMSVAYLATRLQQSRLSRNLTRTFFAVLVVLICGSRVYLGVHYPSDVLAGVIVGLAWSAFCMAALEAAQLYARRNAPALVEGVPAGAPAKSPIIGAAVAGAEAGDRRARR